MIFFPTCMGPGDFPHTKTQTWVPWWEKRLYEYCQWLLSQSVETQHALYLYQHSHQDSHFLCTEKQEIFTFPAASSSLLSSAACPDSSLISAAEASAIMGTTARMSRVSSQPKIKDIMILRPMLEKFCISVAIRDPAAWWNVTRYRCMKIIADNVWRVRPGFTQFVGHEIRLTPWTWAASAASLVVSAPTLFWGLSNQPRSYKKKLAIVSYWK